MNGEHMSAGNGDTIITVTDTAFTAGTGLGTGIKSGVGPRGTPDCPRFTTSRWCHVEGAISEQKIDWIDLPQMVTELP